MMRRGRGRRIRGGLAWPYRVTSVGDIDLGLVYAGTGTAAQIQASVEGLKCGENDHESRLGAGCVVSC